MAGRDVFPRRSFFSQTTQPVGLSSMAPAAVPTAPAVGGVAPASATLLGQLVVR